VVLIYINVKMTYLLQNGMGKKRKLTVTIMWRLRMSGTEAVLPYLPSLLGQNQLDHFTGTVHLC